MTAELIVMNKNGIALAADSAVTISEGSEAKKIYNTANKLFCLSKRHPVGVMIYGSSQIMGLPWEILVKRYRQRVGDLSHASLQGYVDSFFEYLSESAFEPSFYRDFVEQRATLVTRLILWEATTELSKIEGSGQPVDDNIREATLNARIKSHFDSTREHQRSLKINRKDIQGSLSAHRSVAKEAALRELGERKVSGIHLRRLIDSCLLYAIIFPGDGESGLVFAGYGEDDLFPSVRAYEIHKILDGNIGFGSSYEGGVSLKNPADVRAFAQSNETQNFMFGLNRRMEDYLRRGAKELLIETFADVVTGMLVDEKMIPKSRAGQCRAKVSAIGGGAHSVLEKQLETISREEFYSPVIAAVTHFSPTEMAQMAETLVNLESFRQQVTLSSETVGGPIDVAVITRGDGFIWIKRKHYFDPSLNHQFFRNYNLRFEEVSSDDPST